MSRASHTPVPFWLQMPIRRLFAWIETINEVEKEEAEGKSRNRTAIMRREVKQLGRVTKGI